jgi:hypothetical protein
MKKLLLETQSETDDVATLAAEAVRKFEEHPDRQILRERDAKLHGDLATIERELAGLPGAPIDEDPAEALAAGREPVRPDWQVHHARRADLEEQRSLLRRALDMVARRQGETDARVTREVLSSLAAPWARFVADQAQAVRDVARRNDTLSNVSELLARSGLVGSSAILRPMSVKAIGEWADENSHGRLYWREALEHGYVKDAD